MLRCLHFAFDNLHLAYSIDRREYFVPCTYLTINSFSFSSLRYIFYHIHFIFNTLHFAYPVHVIENIWSVVFAAVLLNWCNKLE